MRARTIAVNALLWWKYDARWYLDRWAEKALMALVWRLPRRLVYWCAIRVVAHATQGPYSAQIVPDLSAMDALKRWEPRAPWNEAIG
jgi:hypothetical protein